MMALFKKSATKAEPTKAEAKKEVVIAEVVTKTDATDSGTKSQREGRSLDLAQVLVRPHVTEKASDLSEKGVYVFEINKRANKMHVRLAIEKQFKVKPVKIAVINESTKYAKNPKTNRVIVKKAGLKKAFVYLKKGDKIEFV